MSSRPDPRLTPHRTLGAAGVRPVRAPHPVRPAVSLSATAVAPAATPLAFAARAAATVAGLRIDPDGALTEVAVPLRATTWALAEFTDTAAGPAGLETLTLDRDLLAWAAQPDPAQPARSGHRARHNPVASVAAAMFGSPGPLHGPVVFTGRRPDGQLDHISVAAVVLLAAAAPPPEPSSSLGSASTSPTPPTPPLRCPSRTSWPPWSTPGATTPSATPPWAPTAGRGAWAARRSPCSATTSTTPTPPTAMPPTPTSPTPRPGPGSGPRATTGPSMPPSGAEPRRRDRSLDMSHSDQTPRSRGGALRQGRSFGADVQPTTGPLEVALAELAGVFGDPWTAREVGAVISCGEIDALAWVLDLAGHTEQACALLCEHARTDDHGDPHAALRPLPDPGDPAPSQAQLLAARSHLSWLHRSRLRP